MVRHLLGCYSNIGRVSSPPHLHSASDVWGEYFGAKWGSRPGWVDPWRDLARGEKAWDSVRFCTGAVLSSVNVVRFWFVP
jgi:hypothetical protein